MSRDVQIAGGVGNAPQSYTVPNATEIIPRAVNATFDGTAAVGSFVPTLEIVSDGGVVIARVPADTTVLAGGSAEVTFAPFLGRGSGAGTTGYVQVQDEGAALTERQILDFVGPGVTATDDAGGARTKVTVPGSTISGVFVPFILPLAPSDMVTPGTNTLYGVRWVAPATGTLAGIATYFDTSSGNYEVGVYDTTATTRNRLYTSGNVAFGIGGQWVELATPNLAVTRGDHLDLCIRVDNAIVRIAYLEYAAGIGAAFGGPLPAGYLTSPLGGKPVYSWNATAIAAIPATIAEASLNPYFRVPVLLTRMS